jgi:replicative DNA helicase
MEKDILEAQIDLEAAVADSVLLEAGKNIHCVDIDLEDFTFLPAKAIIGCAKDKGIVDAVLASTWAADKGFKASVVDCCLNAAATSRNLTTYVTQFKMLLYKKKIRELKSRIMLDARTTEDLLLFSKQIEKDEAALSAKYIERYSTSNLMEAAADLFNSIKNGIDTPGLQPTYIPFFDEMLCGGLLGNELFILAARPGIGKTAFALQMSRGRALHKKKTGFFSLEMSKKQFAPRLLAAEAKRSTQMAARQASKLSPNERKEFLDCSSDVLMVAEHILVEDSHDQSMRTIRANARRMVEKDQVGMIIVDYIQLITPEDRSIPREQQVSAISRDLKNMSKELDVPVVALSQMNRGVENENRLPKKSDLRESGSLEQDANIILFLHSLIDIKTAKKGDDIPTAYLLAKFRDGAEDYCQGVFSGQCQEFYRTRSM